MPDIAKCKGITETQDCPIRTTCYRFTSTPSEHRQSYFAVLPLLGKYGCQYFMPTDPEPTP